MSEDILIVEDDEAIAEGLALNLKFDGYNAIVVTDGMEALDRLRADPFRLVLLDITLPSLSGLDVLAELRRVGNHVPVIVLSARRDEFDKVAALRLGADDYVTKPFALAELLARVAAVLRRFSSGVSAAAAAAAAAAEPAARPASPSESDEAPLQFSDVTVDLTTRIATRSGQPVKLTHLEFELLTYFVKNPTRVFSREQLLRQVWGLASSSRRTVDNFVAQLRAKLEKDPDEPRHFVTVRGSGYRFDP